MNRIAGNLPWNSVNTEDDQNPTKTFVNGYMNALNALSLGVILIEDNCSVVHANEVAINAIDNKSIGFKISSDGGLYACDTSSTRQLRQITRGLISGGMQGPYFIPAEKVSGQVVSMACVRRLQTANKNQAPWAVVCFNGLTQAPKTGMIRHVFNLTPSEAELAAALAGGSSVSQYASCRNVSLNTVNTHLKSIMRKTCTSRQSDLVRLIMTNAPIMQLASTN